MTITSVQVKNDVGIKFHESNDQAGKSDKLSINSAEEPRPELRAALEALGPHVCDMLEVDREWEDGITVQKVTIEHKGSSKIYKISGLKDLQKSRTTFAFETPPRSDLVKEGGADFALDKDVVVLLQKVEREATRYLKGDRSQAQLNLDGKEAA